MRYSAWPALRYLGMSRGSVIECTCACRRILTTSIGHTTATASVTPAPRPAVHPCQQRHATRGDVPKKMDGEEVLPVVLSVKKSLYVSNDAKRIAIFGTIPLTTAPRPLYSPSGDSFFTIATPVAMNPRALTCRDMHQHRATTGSGCGTSASAGLAPCRGTADRQAVRTLPGPDHAAEGREGRGQSWTYTLASGTPTQLHADLDRVERVCERMSTASSSTGDSRHTSASDMPAAPPARRCTPMGVFFLGATALSAVDMRERDGWRETSNEKAIKPTSRRNVESESGSARATLLGHDASSRARDPGRAGLQMQVHFLRRADTLSAIR